MSTRMLQITFETFFQDLVNQFINVFPKIAGALVFLAIGWIAGRVLGKAVSSVLDRAGVDDALRKNVFGRALERSGVTVARFFDLIGRWFVYLVAILAAVNILEISILTSFMNQIVSYLPSLIAGMFVLIVGFIVSDWVAETFEAFTAEAEIEFARIFVTGLRFFLYFVVMFIALTQMRLDLSILDVFVNAMAWGIGIGVGVGLAIALGWGLKGVVAGKADEWIEKARETAKKVEEAGKK